MHLVDFARISTSAVPRALPPYRALVGDYLRAMTIESWVRVQRVLYTGNWLRPKHGFPDLKLDFSEAFLRRPGGGEVF